MISLVSYFVRYLRRHYMHIAIAHFFYLALLFVAFSPYPSHWPLLSLASSPQFMDNAVPKK